MGAPEPCVGFYREHVEADAVHEQVVRPTSSATSLRANRDLDRDVVFGIRARDFVEDRLADHVMACWQAGGRRYAGRFPDRSGR